MDRPIIELIQTIQMYPSLLLDLSISQAFHFIFFASALKSDIAQAQSVLQSRDEIPPTISPTIIKFIGEALSLSDSVVEDCWSAFKHIAWDFNLSLANKQHEVMFEAYGWQKSLTHRTLYPSNLFCLSNGCDPAKPLTETKRRQVVLCTLDTGPIPAYAIHRKCRVCRSSYHPNYTVQDGMRTYYQGLASKGPTSAVQVGEHQFIEIGLINVFINLMLLSWTSGTNCARWYNDTFAEKSLQPDDGLWPCQFNLDTDHVWDSVTLLTLLEHHDREEVTLTVPHSGLQKDRFTKAIEARNRWIVQFGQPELRHACTGCMKVLSEGDSTYYIDAVVTDGVTLGHPCCHVQDCKVDLQSNRDEFCPVHIHLRTTCRIQPCGRQIRPGYKTCDIPLHQEREAKLKEKGTAMFQLKSRLERLCVTHPNDSMAESLHSKDGPDTEESAAGASDEALAEVAMAEAEAACDEKSPDGNVKITARFARRRTHNEQLIIRPCGIILSRATCYGSEAISSVKDMILTTFRDIGLLSYLFYDNNCSLHKHLKAQDDTSLDQVGKPVDIFHFRSKHSGGDLVCQTHCNPAMFDDLMEDGKWVFNSSIAEQTNVWFGGYHSIVREMCPAKYRFFLDEMILRRNW